MVFTGALSVALTQDIGVVVPLNAGPRIVTSRISAARVSGSEQSRAPIFRSP
jgi:hypothetical protein